MTASTVPSRELTRSHTQRSESARTVLLTRVPKSAQPWLATLIRTIFDQPDADAVRAQFARVVDTIAGKYPAAAEYLGQARDDLLAFTVFPHEIWI
jgi:putative transposase